MGIIKRLRLLEKRIQISRTKMPPRNNIDEHPFPTEASTAGEVAPVVTEETHENKVPPLQIVWRNVMWFVYLHALAVYGLYCIPFAHPLTWAWTVLTYMMAALGITAGAHRLWAHRSYKAKLPLRILLAIFNSMAFENDIIDWSRDHRVHHRYSETHADPHNAKRGFFFAHMGWLLVRKHPDVKDKGKNVDISDLLRDPVCMFQRKVYIPSVILLTFVLPTWVPWYFWGESAINAFMIAAIFKYAILLNVTWAVNSVAHLFGNRPYDHYINPRENVFVTFGAMGEGFHNYHHTFPSDYSTSEYGWRINLTTLFIDCMAAIGLASNRKKMSYEMVFRRKTRTGDGSTGFGYDFVGGKKFEERVQEAINNGNALPKED